jgi:hypothetical protein
MASEFGPESRTMPTPPCPDGVAIAQIVSLSMKGMGPTVLHQWEILGFLGGVLSVNFSSYVPLL